MRRLISNNIFQSGRFQHNSYQTIDCFSAGLYRHNYWHTGRAVQEIKKIKFPFNERKSQRWKTTPWERELYSAVLRKPITLLKGICKHKIRYIKKVGNILIIVTIKFAKINE